MWWVSSRWRLFSDDRFEKLRFHWLFGFKEELFVRRDGLTGSAVI
jgi:hypothetical protein